VQHANPAQLPTGGALLVIGLIALALLVRHESRAGSPLIPLKLLRMSAIWHSDAMAACHGAALVSLITFVPIFLEVVRGASPSETGLLLVPLTIGIGTGSLLTGRLVSRTGRTTVYPIGGLVVATATLLALALWAPDLSNLAISGILLVNGLSMGTVMGVVQVIVQNAAGSMRLGEAAASVQFSRSMGAAFGTALVGTVLFAFLALRNPNAAHVFAEVVQHLGGGGQPIPAAQRGAIHADVVAAFRAAFLLIGGFTTIGLVMAYTNPQRRL
jgi:predicted MFS family arabinose efflux permease